MTQRSESKVVGSYANFLVVGHNAFEFVFDFGQLYEGSDTPHMHTRIITAPVYAKAMLATLRASLERFETANGAIPEVDAHGAAQAAAAPQDRE
ncbi:MAG TPA: DUF3467 domain-containing protein [Steroidobacteraceae bacterium]|nr:DUF3467 domain-containing protein [Steroidobacteraceae bacterium]